ncbi:MAG: alpha/beta hydrolase [Planctomyces sp.]|nr:alpha/beta hydrolase [Planctomyces sp.]
MRRFLPLLLLAACLAPQARLLAAAEPIITEDVVYGHKDGMALTFDVLQPEQPNGAGVMFIQSGGWYSPWAPPKSLIPVSQPLLDQGLTVFIVRHGSAPRYTIPEIVPDVRRAVRVIRQHASRWDVDPNRLGALGGSAGGHLALMLATTGDDGDPSASDPALKHSSRIAAAVAFFPPTDIRGWTTDPPEIIKSIPTLKPPLTFDADLEDDFSPLLHVGPQTAPVLLIHGDQDELVPISHSLNIMPAFEQHGVDSRLLTIEGAAHGFNAEQNKVVIPAMVDWFVTRLAKPTE